MPRQPTDQVIHDTWARLIQQEQQNRRDNAPTTEGEQEMPRTTLPPEGTAIVTINHVDRFRRSSEHGSRQVQASQYETAADWVNLDPIREHLNEQIASGRSVDPSHYSVDHAGEQMQVILARFGMSCEHSARRHMGLAVAAILRSEVNQNVLMRNQRNTYDRALRREQTSYRDQLAEANRKLAEVERKFHVIEQVARAADKWRANVDEPIAKVQAFKELTDAVERSETLDPTELVQVPDIAGRPSVVFEEARAMVVTPPARTPQNPLSIAVDEEEDLVDL